MQNGDQANNWDSGPSDPVGDIKRMRAMEKSNTINIYSIFRSINGEVCRFGQGSWSTFIRFAGCNLRCKWCDTEYAQDASDGTKMTIDQIIEQVELLRCKNITITGGEPLFQRQGLHKLLKKLIALRYKVSIETNGTFPIIDGLGHLRDEKRPSWVVDYKLPYSGECEKVRTSKIWKQLTDNDFIKFVINTTNRIDYDVALVKVCGFWDRNIEAQMVFSPMIYKYTSATDLAVNTLYRWMQQNELVNVFLNVQLHKLVELQEPN